MLTQQPTPDLQGPEAAKRSPFLNDGPPVSYEELILPPAIQHAHAEQPTSIRKILFTLLGAALFTWGWLAGAYWESREPAACPAPQIIFTSGPKDSPAVLPVVAAFEEATPALASTSLPASQEAISSSQPSAPVSQPASIKVAAPKPSVATPKAPLPKEATKPKVASDPWKSISMDVCKIIGEGNASIRVTVAIDGTITSAEGTTPLEKCVAKRLQGKVGFLPDSEEEQTITVKVR